ncbi:MAG TPA: hypothetical protein VME67_03915 [Mycobacterium sp.]|nr:hypothetical protein [Mycobacterium sp.]HTX94050.1 hypothetical protein [Mycobacterium sp.]
MGEREYIDEVILADAREPARARCMTSFAHDLDRDETGNWVAGCARACARGWPAGW